MPFIKSHLCKICTEKDPLKFSKYQKSTCKKCMYIRIKSKNYVIDKSWHKRHYAKNILSIRICQAKIRASNKNYSFDIDEQYLKDLIKLQQSRCAYSNRVFDNSSKINSLSIDRIKSNEGYIKGNVQLVTSAINKMKSDMSEEDFLSLIKDVFNKFNI